MKPTRKLLTISALSLTLLTSPLFAQDHHDDHGQDRRDNNQNGQNYHNDDHNNQRGQGDHYVHHNDWRRGHRMNNADWSRGQRIDYQQYHLGAPRRGYEWRQVDGNYVMAAVATGLIASVVIASTVH